MKEAVLGKKYELSLVFVGDAISRRLNKKYRKKDKATNILSFPLTKDNGEIFINLKIAKKDAPKFEKSYNNFVKFLFIHGCLHLKGFEHGVGMEKMEEKFSKEFDF